MRLANTIHKRRNTSAIWRTCWSSKVDLPRQQAFGVSGDLDGLHGAGTGPERHPRVKEEMPAMVLLTME